VDLVAPTSPLPPAARYERFTPEQRSRRPATTQHPTPIDDSGDPQTGSGLQCKPDPDRWTLTGARFTPGMLASGASPSAKGPATTVRSGLSGRAAVREIIFPITCFFGQCTGATVFLVVTAADRNRLRGKFSPTRQLAQGSA
jgi:hypothetical protein